MTISANPGPSITYGITQSSSGAIAEYNEDRGPSLNDLGEGTMDPRAPFLYRPGNRPGTPVYGWAGCFGGPVVDFVPIALNTSGIAAAFTSTGASATPTTVTLTTSATSSSFRTISAFVPSTVPVSNPSSISVLMLDGYQGGFAVGQGSSWPTLGPGCGFGQPNPGWNTAGLQTGAGAPTVGNATINLWNPLIMGGRCLTITNSSATTSDSATTYFITGYDCYGMRMTQSIAGAGAGATVTTLKAFKYIQSITFTSTTPGTAPVLAVSIGVSDTYGFPLYVDHPGYITLWLGPASSAVQITANGGGHTFGYGSSIYGALPLQTYGSSLASGSSLGDVRGTYTSSLASTGNTAASASSGFRVVMNISPRVANLATIGVSSSLVSGPANAWGLVGLGQV